jgi:hypothetical protein
MVRVNFIKDYIKELYQQGSCLLVIILPDGMKGEYQSYKMSVYLDGEKKGEKKYNSKRLDVHDEIVTACSELGLEPSGIDNMVLFAYKEKNQEERQEAYHWVKEKLKENGIEWSENKIRILLGLPSKQ